LRRSIVIHAVGPPGEDDSLQVEVLDRLTWCILRDNLAVDLSLADATCDQVAVLGAVVEDRDCLKLVR